MRKHGERLYPTSLVVVEAPDKVAALSKILGPDAAVIATGGSLKTSTLRDDGTLLWTDLVGTKHPAQEAWRRRLQSERGLVKEVLIATDDDLAGELLTSSPP
jgi:DNA topoisomerase IA